MFDMPASGSWEQRGGWVVAALMRDLGLTREQACGLVGNLGFESRGFEAMQEVKPQVAGSRGGYGWAQWTGPRRRNFEAWCAQHGLRPEQDEANYGFLLAELRGAHSGFLNRLRTSQSLEAATSLTHRVFENPQDVADGTFESYPDRLNYAERLLADAPPATADAAPGSSGDGGVEEDDADDREFARSLGAIIQQVLVAAGEDIEVDGILGPASRDAFDRLASRTQ